jgi:hypothetical protein
MDQREHQAQGPLEEFSALRQEILMFSQELHNIFIFQVAAAGAVFSFALSEADRAVVALAVPVVTYLLLARYYYAYRSIVDVGEYIRTVLSGKLEGLEWEDWRQRGPRKASPRRFRANNVLMLAFPLTAFLALAIGTAGLWLDISNNVLRLAILIPWFASVLCVILTLRLLLQMASYRARLRAEIEALPTT